MKFFEELKSENFEKTIEDMEYYESENYYYVIYLDLDDFFNIKIQKNLCKIKKEFFRGIETNFIFLYNSTTNKRIEKKNILFLIKDEKGAIGIIEKKQEECEKEISLYKDVLWKLYNSYINKLKEI